MGSLSPRGDVAIAILVIYPFIFALALVLLIRHGVRRHLGWLFIFTFALIRIVGGALRIAAGECLIPLYLWL
jgi:hypothetical protein